MEDSVPVLSSEVRNGPNTQSSHLTQTTLGELPQPSEPNDGSTIKPTIRQIREAMTSPPASPIVNNFSMPAPPQPKKKSLFGGLFMKEPTQVALNQVTAQMLAQHGSTSATRVPHVRMEKMPEHVPKVNSKWDGLPDSVKMKMIKDKENQRVSKRQSLTYSNRSRSADSMGNRTSSKNYGSRDTYSQNSSVHSHTKSSSSHTSHSNHQSTRFYAQSVNSSADLASQQRAKNPPHVVRSRSFNSPPRTASTDHEQSRTQHDRDFRIKPLRPGNNLTRHQSDPASPNIPRSELSKATITETTPAVEAIPEYSKSPVTTPREMSPVTPSQGFSFSRPLHDQDDSRSEHQREIILTSPNDEISARPKVTKKQETKNRNSAFLAGEARPFELPEDDDNNNDNEEAILSQHATPLQQLREKQSSWSRHGQQSKSIDRVMEDVQKRPDSSRKRLGLRASMVVRPDLFPWDYQKVASEPGQDSDTNTLSTQPPLSPKRMLAKPFSRLGKETK